MEKAASDLDEKDVREEEQTFEELGLDPRLIRALTKKGIQKPTPIQRLAIPLIFEGKDVAAQANTGSGKTFAYLLPLLQKLFSDSSSKTKLAPTAFILVPTFELGNQVYLEVSSLIKLCRVQLIVRLLTSTEFVPASVLRMALAGPPDILVSTPRSIQECLSAGVLQPKHVQDSLSFLILDEADYLLSFGCEDDLKALTAHVPKRCQGVLMSATPSAAVEKLRNLFLHNPCNLTLPDVGDIKDEIVPKNVQQFWISCSAHDKVINILALLKLELVQKKLLIFTNTIDVSFRLKLLFEQFGIKSAVLNAELPQNSRLHILEEFNAGLFDYLIATDDSHSKEKEKGDWENPVKRNKPKKHAKQKLDSEFGVARGIDFKNVHTVINYQMPQSVAGYVHRIGRTGRAYNTGVSISLVSPEEMEIFEEIRCILGENDSKDSNLIAPFSLLSKNAVESLRYRAEDVARSVTNIAVREIRAQDLRNEILNSDKLKAHFQANPRDLDLLKHDKVLSKRAPAPHLHDVPEYLLDPKTQEARKIVKLARAAMGRNTNSPRHKRLKGKFRKSRDPLKAFSVEAANRASNGGLRSKGKGGDDGHKHKRKRSV